MIPRLIDKEGGKVLLFPGGRELTIDFSSRTRRYQKPLRGRQELIAKAVGLSGRKELLILDATAGLGEDLWVLARLGARMVGVEREPLLFELLQTALERALQDEKLKPVAERITLLPGDAGEILRNWSGERPATVYLDPMFPESGKTALPKLEMQLLRGWLPSTDLSPILEAAFDVALDRVVIKRPAHAPLAWPAPQHQYRGKAVRFDFYPARRVP